MKKLTTKMEEALRTLARKDLVVSSKGIHWMNAEHVDTRVCSALEKRGLAQKSWMSPIRRRRVGLRGGGTWIMGWERMHWEPTYGHSSGTYPEYAITEEGLALLDQLDS